MPRHKSPPCVRCEECGWIGTEHEANIRSGQDPLLMCRKCCSTKLSSWPHKAATRLPDAAHLRNPDQPES